MPQSGEMKSKVKSWEVSDLFWEKVEPLIPRPQRDASRTYQRRMGGGRKPMDPRKVFCAIVYVLRTGIQWKALPREFGSASSVHAYFLKWARDGLFVRLWQRGLAEYDEMEGIAWSWQSIDGSQGKAPLATGAVGPNPTDREKKGTRRHILVDGNGLPLSIVVTGANRHDVTQVENVLASRVMRPQGEMRQNLCADAGYDSEEARTVMRSHGYTPHVRSRGEEKRELAAGKRARRWIVEVAHSWFNRFRKILVRFEKKKSSFEGLLHLAAAIIVYRKLGVIYG